MSRNIVFFSIAVLLMFAANVAMPVLGEEPAPASPTDPIEWSKPAQDPIFREVLKESDYKSQFDKAAAQIDVPSLEKSKSPVAGERIVKITPGGAAEHLGMHVDDVITRLDGEQLWAGISRNRDRLETLTFVTKDGAVHDVPIQPGLIGVRTRFEWHPESAYLRGKDRDPRWDKLVLVGIVTRNTNPDLAETALHRAVDAGFVPNRLIAGVGAEIALEQGRNDAALDFIWSALVQHAADGLMQLEPKLLYRVAIANYKVDVAAGILDDYKGLMPIETDTLRALAKMHRARPYAERHQPPPSQIAAKMRRFDLDLRLKPANELTTRYFGDRLAHTPFKLDVPTSHYLFLQYQPKPAVRDFDAVLKLTLRPTDAKKSDYAKIFEVGLVNESQSGGGSAFVDGLMDPSELFVSLASSESNATVETIGHSGIPGVAFFDDPLIKLDGTQMIELRMVRIAGQGEIFINGRRILYAPIDSKAADLGLMLKLVGMTAEFKEIHISELLPRTTVHQDADGAVVLKPADVNLHGDAIRYETDADKACIGYWTNQPDWIDWDVQIDKPGKFEVALTTACAKGSGGSGFVVTAGPEKLSGKVKETSDWTVFNREKLGTIEVAKPGRITISVKATSMPGPAVMNLRQVELTPGK